MVEKTPYHLLMYNSEIRIKEGDCRRLLEDVKRVADECQLAKDQYSYVLGHHFNLFNRALDELKDFKVANNKTSELEQHLRKKR